MMKKVLLFLFVAASALLTSCLKTELSGDKSSVKFTVVSNAGGTKTAYSGSETTDGGKTYERIDWKQGDQLRIWSDVAVNRNNNNHWAEYNVTPSGTSSGRTSQATISAVGGNGLVWGNAGAYTFYGLYPSLASDTGAQGLFTCQIPDEQTFTFANGVGAPDMNSAFMAGKATASNTVAGEGVPVSLEFDPAFTAFQITLRSKEKTLYLGSFSLQSDGGSPVAGKFSIDLGGSTTAYTPSSVSGETQSQITVPLGNIQLTTTADLTFTVFALPEQLSDLSITFNAKENLTDTDYIPSTLKLQQNSAYIPFAPCVKHRIVGLALDVDKWTVLVVNGEDVEWDTEALGHDIIWDD